MSSKMPNQKQVHPTMTFQDMVSGQLLKQVEPVIQRAIQQAAFEVQRRLAQQQLAFQAAVTTDIAALKQLLIDAGTTTESGYREKVWTVEDNALGFAQLSPEELSEVGTRLRGKLSFKDKGGLHEQPITTSHLAQEPRVLMGSLEEYLVGHKVGDVVSLPDPAPGVTEVTVEILRLSKNLNPPPPPAPPAPEPQAEAAPEANSEASAPAQAEAPSEPQASEAAPSAQEAPSPAPSEQPAPQPEASDENSKVS